MWRGHPEFADRRTTKVIDGVALTGWFTEDFTWAELAHPARPRTPARHPRHRAPASTGAFPIMRLRDVFDLIDDALDRTLAGALGMVAEIKHATYFESIGLPLDELFAAEVNEAGWNDGDGRSTIESFERHVLDQVYARGIYGKRVYLIEASGTPVRPGRPATAARAAPYADSLTEAGLYALGRARRRHQRRQEARFSNTDAAGDVAGASDLVDCAHAAGLEIYCWTLRPENRFLARSLPTRHGRARTSAHWQAEFALIMGTGIDGVFADHPDLAVAVRDDALSIAACGSRSTDA